MGWLGFGEALEWREWVRERRMYEDLSERGAATAAEPEAVLGRRGCSKGNPLPIEEWRHIFRTWTRKPPVVIASQNGPGMQIKKWVSIRDHR